MLKFKIATKQDLAEQKEISFQRAYDKHSQTSEGKRLTLGMAYELGVCERSVYRWIKDRLKK